MEWVVPRSRCAYRRLDLTAVPVKRRRQAAAIAVAAEAASASTDTVVAWQDGIAHVWSHDFEAGTRPRAWIPETLLRPAAPADGARLVACLEGVEGQFWRGGRLVASRWWAEAPGVLAWERFLRGAGAEVDTRVPAAQHLGWSQPWARRTGIAALDPAALEGVLWKGLFATLVLVAGWDLARVQVVDAKREGVQRDLERARRQAAPLLAARERAEAAADDLARWQGLVQPVSDYTLMADVVAPLPKGSRLVAWQRDKEKLTAAVQGPDMDARKYVLAFAKNPRLADVEATPTELGTMQLVFTFVPRQEEAP